MIRFSLFLLILFSPIPAMADGIFSDFCFFGHNRWDDYPYVEEEIVNHDIPAQWRGITWEPNVWAENWPEKEYGRLWTPKRVLDNLFRGGYFGRQYVCGGKPFLSVGLPFFDLSELDRLRSLQLLAQQSGVLKKNAAFEIYSLPHHSLIGRYSQAGLTLY